MHRLLVSAAAGLLLAGLSASGASAQVSDGAANILKSTEFAVTFEPVACGPHWARCRPFHHWVCNRFVCGCVHC
jgi:hypothetical protein